MDDAVPVAGMDVEVVVDLETWRVREGLTYEALADVVGLPSTVTARRYALGERWPDAEVVERITRATDGAVGVLAMHRRRLAWCRANGLPRVPAVVERAAEAAE
jgi:transcriptional regulator with XRE-family HTH domain